MKPYRSLVRLVLRSSLLPIALLVTLSPMAVTGTGPGEKKVPVASPHLRATVLSRSGFSHFYNMDYDKAIRDFEREVQERPEDPVAANHLLTAVLFKELYRVGALDTEIYANDSFMSARQFSPDAQTRQRIRELTERALALSEKRLQANSNDVEALYARGVTRGTRATTMGMLDKNWFAALRSAVGARHDHERVLELDPQFTDAKMIVGMHNYIMGSVSWAIKVGAAVVGLSGSKEKGIQYLYEAAHADGESSVDAKIALSLFLRREQRYSEAIELVGQLAQAYPRNFLVALELANLQNAAGHGPGAIAAYRKLLSAGHDGQYFDPRLEQAAWGLGQALSGQRDYSGAAEAFDSVSRFPKVEPELLERATLAAGQMYDLLQRHDLAIKKYQDLISSDSNSPRAREARKYVKQPYRM